MNFGWTDLLRYLEVTALVMGVSVALAHWLPMPDARQRLRFLYLTLILCLVAPLCAIRHDREVLSLGPPPPQYDSLEVVNTADGTIYVERPLLNLWRKVGPVARWMLFLASLRILWLCIGLIRLSLYRRRAKLLAPLPDHLREVRARQRVDAQLYVSKEVNGPVTFGFLRPTVLLPEYFDQIGEAQQSAAVCHELAHVRRNDAVTVFGEEVLRSLLWFHPLVWWLLDRIQLCREQVVDAETIGITEDRATYLETLLTFAQRTAIPDLAAATPFLKRNHLIERMNSIAKEVKMPERIKRLNAFALYTLMPCALALGIWMLPLRGQTVLARDTPGVLVETPYLILHRGPVEIPAAVIGKKIGGAVVVNVTVDNSGEVTDARVLSGPEELRPAVLRSVKGWHFDTQQSVPPKQFEVTVRFDPRGAIEITKSNNGVDAGRYIFRAPETTTDGDWFHGRGHCPDACSEFESSDIRVEADEIDYNGSTESIDARGHVYVRNLKNGKERHVDRAVGQLSGFGEQANISGVADLAYAGKPLPVARVDASALADPLRGRALAIAGIKAGDKISQLELGEKLQALHASEPSVQFAWSNPANALEVYLYPMGGSPPQMAPSARASIRVSGVRVNSLPEPLRQRVLDRIDIHEGDLLSPGDYKAKQDALQEIDRHLVLRPLGRENADGGVTLQVQLQTSTGPAPAPSVQFAPGAPQPVYTVTPVYPPLAIQARVQGTIRFAVFIGADGTVQNLQLISGHPLMVPAATEALKEFRFEPTGATVKTTASVIFSLNQ